MSDDQQPNGTNRPTSQEVAIALVVLIVLTSTRNETVYTLLVEWLFRSLSLPR